MKDLYKKKRQDGFTIIEVLIVLAIAGLIILIVFLAVPALQRNSRNTQRKNQAAAYIGAVNEFINNNNGALPTTVANVTTINGLAADGPMTEPSSAPASGNQTAALALDNMQLVTNAKCDTGTIGNTTTGGASNRSVALRFTVENSTGGVVMQCQES